MKGATCEKEMIHNERGDNMKMDDTKAELRELTSKEVSQVSGGLDPDIGGVTIILISITGGPLTALFGVPIGVSLLLANS